MLVIKRSAYLKRNRFKPDVLPILLSCCLKFRSHRILYLLVYLLLIETLLIRAVQQAGCCKSPSCQCFSALPPAHTKTPSVCRGTGQKAQGIPFSRCCRLKEEVRKQFFKGQPPSLPPPESARHCHYRSADEALMSHVHWNLDVRQNRMKFTQDPTETVTPRCIESFSLWFHLPQNCVPTSA